ncbi:MAG: FapA family protein [Peptococcaceae bacterium]|nr:FapA family protein [Peptococcaceae bacterium]
MNNSDPSTQHPIDAQADITVSQDKQKAFLTLTAPKNGGNPISVPIITHALTEAGVVHGIREETINALVRTPHYGREDLVATATPPENGQDATLSYLFSLTKEAKPKVHSDGSVDFKQLDIVQNINADEPLCSKTPATPGTPGTDILGGVIDPQPGKDKPLPSGKNTYVSENGLDLLAKVSGQVDLVQNRVTVLNVFEIAENVDYSTGNIDFVGNVTVGGDVCAGFLVRAGGNVFIKGSVDGGTIEAEGDVTIAKGFNSQTSGKIKCNGNLRCRYLQNANVDVGQDLETTSCVKSIVRVGGNAKFVGSQAMLLASRVTAGQTIEAFNIGSQNSLVSNIIEVGVNPSISERAARIPEEIKQCTDNIKNLSRVITHYEQLQERNRLADEKQAELANLKATVKSTEQDLLALDSESQDVRQKMEQLGFGSVKVTGTAFAGTQITIGSEKKVLTTDHQFTQFTRTQEGIQTSSAR